MGNGLRDGRSSECPDLSLIAIMLNFRPIAIGRNLRNL